MSWYAHLLRPQMGWAQASPRPVIHDGVAAPTFTFQPWSAGWPQAWTAPVPAPVPSVAAPLRVRISFSPAALARMKELSTARRPWWRPVRSGHTELPGTGPTPVQASQPPGADARPVDSVADAACGPADDGPLPLDDVVAPATPAYPDPPAPPAPENPSPADRSGAHPEPDRPSSPQTPPLIVGHTRWTPPGAPLAGTASVPPAAAPSLGDALVIPPASDLRDVARRPWPAHREGGGVIEPAASDAEPSPAAAVVGDPPDPAARISPVPSEPARTDPPAGTGGDEQSGLARLLHRLLRRRVSVLVPHNRHHRGLLVAVRREYVELAEPGPILVFIPTTHIVAVIDA